MQWTIEYFDEKVMRTILNLPKKLQARYFRLTDLIEEFGPFLGMPHTKPLGESLHELRVKSPEGIARIFYCTVIDKRIIMLHCFIKKTEKLPNKELAIARSRLWEVVKNAK